MKKYFVVCLSLFAITNSSFAIKVKPCDCANYKEKVFQYFNNIYNAEKFIIENEYDSALYYYVNASLLIPIMTTDITNINKLIYKPISKESIYYCFYNTFRLLPDSISSDSYLKRISNIIPLDVVAKLDSTLPNVKKFYWTENSNKIDISIALDSLSVISREGGSVWKDGHFKKGKSPRKKLNQQLIRCLMELYKRYGTINFNQFHGLEYINCNEILKYSFYDTKLQKKYSRFFENEIQCGNMNPRIYEQIVDDYLFDSTQVYGYHTVFYVGDTLIVYQLSDEGQKRINENRSRIDLQDIETTHKKLIWQWQHYDEFMFSTIREIIPLDDSQTATNLAVDHLREMGSMVVGYTYYTR